MNQEIKVSILKGYNMSAPLEMIEAVSPDAFITIRQVDSDNEEATMLKWLPKQFLVHSDDLTILHSIWLKRKHAGLMMVYNRKTKMVAVSLGE